MSETGQVTSQLLWRATAFVLPVDVLLLIIVGRYVSSGLFGKLKWYLAAAAGLVYALLWLIFGSVYFWEAVYQAVFPAWSRWLLPVGYGLLFGMLAVAFWYASRLVRRGQVVWFCLLGGLVSLAGHSIGIQRGLLRVPLLAGASAASALVFGVAEFIYYWCAILGLAVAARRLGLLIRKVRA